MPTIEYHPFITMTLDVTPLSWRGRASPSVKYLGKLFEIAIGQFPETKEVHAGVAGLKLDVLVPTDTVLQQVEEKRLHVLQLLSEELENLLK